MKKSIVLILCLCLVLCVVGCSNDTPSETNPTELPQQTEPIEDFTTPSESTHVHAYTTEKTAATCTSIGYTTYTCYCGDTYVDDEVAKLDHDYSEELTEATCTEEGYITYTCVNCNETYKGDYIDKIEHSYKKNVVQPTCTKGGYTTYTCTMCEDSYVDDRVGAIDHNYIGVKTEATCEKQGYTTYTCSMCKDNYIDNYTPLADHSYSPVITAPTCTKEGFTTYTCKCGESYVGDKTSTIPHSYKETLVPATCTENGYTEYSCYMCGDTYKDNYTDMIPHEYKAVVTEPTCTEPGYITYTCACGNSYMKVNAEEIGHAIYAVFVEPTCTEQGYTLYKCSCGYEYKDNFVDPAHKYGDWVITTAATCEKDGMMQKDCIHCDHFETAVIAALGHLYEMATINPTCTEKGYDLYTCSLCDDTYQDNYTDMIAHDMGEWEETEPSTCTTEGKESRYCKKCKYSEVRLKPLTYHDYKKVVTPPTCTEGGYTTCTCKDCGKVIITNRTLPNGHTFIDWTITLNATCTEAGQETRKCLCGHTETRVIDPLGHDEITHQAKPATCTNIGWDEYVTCSRCDYTTYQEIAKTKHNYKETITAPTCTERGYTTHTCENCGNSYKDSYVNALDHTFKAVVTAATCTDEGYTTYTCSMCGAEKIAITAPALGHSFVNYISNGDATCTNDGTKTAECVRRCGETHTMTDSGSMLDHNYNSVVTAPTCTSNGYTTHTCSACGNSYTDNETAMTEHKWSDWTVVKPATTTNAGSEQRQCSACSQTETREIPIITLDENIVAYYKVVDGIVIDLVSGKEMTGATVHDEYFSGGKVALPATYPAYTIETIMIYNRNSTENPISDNFAYYGGAFKFQEIDNPDNWHYIKTPFGGGQIWTDFTLKPSLNYNTRVLSDGESYWAFTVDSVAGSYSVQVNDNYVNKAHWANASRQTFTLSTEHTFKEFIVYSEVLTEEELAEHFDATDINLNAETNTLIGRVSNGLTHLGSAFAFTQTGRYGVPEWYNTQTVAGNYSVNDGNGLTIDYTISDYVEPDLGIDHSKYESVHIINNPETLYLDYKYALSAVPYPFNVNHNGTSDQYDVSWSSSDESIAVVIDGLIIPKKTGTVTITATLRGTTMSDSCTIKIVEKANVGNKVFTVPANYVSDNGNSFSDTNYTMTTNAIYDAIDEAYFAGYNHIIFPQIDFYAAPTGTTYYVPTGMTIEFPEGSAFHMMPSDIAKTDGYTFFQMGGGWWSCAVPANKSYEKTDANGNVLAYYCRDAHLIIDKYYGEFYKEDATMSELNTGANQYAWGCVLLSMGKRAEYCSVEVREANCPTGFFIVMGGKGNNEMINAAGGTIAADKFVSGWLDDTGTIVENSNWISTPDFYTVSPGASNGMDTLHEYYLGDWEHNVVTATQHLYDILWFDENKELIQINRWQYVDEGYSNKPAGAKYFKISMQQSELPTGTDFYIGLYPDEASKFCEIKNTNIINGADGLASVVGATEACWIHDNYVSGDGLLSGACWSLDLEDGWMGMRGTIIERNILRKYAYSSSVGEYRGPDSGILALASGYNTFVISNYLGAIQQSNYNVANTHIINNVIYSQFSSFTGGTPNELRTKINAHVYYNIIGQTSNAISANGVIYYHGNTSAKAINKW